MGFVKTRWIYHILVFFFGVTEGSDEEKDVDSSGSGDAYM